ncbi:cache domain-containing sensor histidine kinase [Muricomes intestini]|uniref:Histidine kinase/DNA gyrase B/HSP90-like ATPase n=1 Tax=Muricomes intestini TaxID=1796634 RepID=A0A4R3KEU3_9FIRM|nr:sensor histidine kinase [Muricomes intestini]TCS81161.1 histidine kinase/DNA gyrase B/HSP90-like ATPase [Muricomes intestini]
MSKQVVDYCENAGKLGEYEQVISEVNLQKGLIANTLGSNLLISSMLIYPEKGDYLSFGEQKYMTTRDYQQWEVYKEGMKAKKAYWLASRQVDEAYGKTDIISYTRPIFSKDFTKPVGLLEVQILTEKMASSFRASGNIEGTGILLLDSKGRSVVKQPDELEEKKCVSEAAKQQIRQEKQSIQLTVKDTEYLLNCIGLKNGWILVHYQPMDNLTRTSGMVGIIILLSGVLVLFLMIILSHPITRQLVRPLNEAIDVMSNMEDSIESSKNEYEITALFDNYNMMMRRIRESELDTLRAQITPHFLYNTLNSIKCRALLDGNRDVAKMTQWLTNLLELSINNHNEYLTLYEEIDMLHSYVGLQQMRSDKIFTFSTKIEPESLGKCLVPKMILQTLVENAILHGIEEQNDSSVIEVHSSLQEGMLHIEVTDNGVGMSKERIDEIFSGRKEDGKQKMNRVGLYNVDQRIKLYFGKSYGISIISSPGKGTAVIVRMPCVEDPKLFRGEKISKRN